MTSQNTEIILAILAILQLATILLVLLQFSPKGGSTKKSKRRIVLDTSAVIDGRILNLAEAGFLDGSQLVSTNLILDELQYLADEGDSLKRSRARYGLEVLNKLFAFNQIEVKTTNLGKSELEVDQQLLNLSKRLSAQLFTADFNLAQRARIEGVSILSPNDLAESLKPQILPGEVFKIKLIQKGDDKGQAVGYLQDGTMVVAESSSTKIGQVVELKSSKIIQTAGGRIVFAQQIQSSRTHRSPRSSKPEQPKQSSSPQRANPKPRRQNREDSLIEAINNSK